MMMNLSQTNVYYLSMIQDQSESNKPLAEVEASNDSGGVQNQSSTNEQDNDASGLLITEPESPNDSAMVQNPSQNLTVVDNKKTYPEESSEHTIVAENERSNLLASFKNDDAENFSPVVRLEKVSNCLSIQIMQTSEELISVLSMIQDLSNYDLCSTDQLLTMIETADDCNVCQSI